LFDELMPGRAAVGAEYQMAWCFEIALQQAELDQRLDRLSADDLDTVEIGNE
jgi:hypothetical protein